MTRARNEIGPQLQAYDRRVSPALMEALAGPLNSLLAFSALDPVRRDVQLRREPWGSRCWASLYLGLTSVLDVDERDGKFRLRAHPTHRKRGHFQPAWSTWQSLSDLTAAWPEVEDYLDRIRHRVDKRWLDAEGRVHAMLANARGSGLSVINREASHAFRSKTERDALFAGWRTPLSQALEGHDDGSTWWRSMRAVHFGMSPDFIATDADGRLLVIEAKPAGATGGIVRGPAQVALYAAMWSAWLSGPHASLDALEEEAAQRKNLGLLAPDAAVSLTRPVRVVPVLAIGPGPISATAWERLRAVARAVALVHEALDPLEVLVLDADGVPAAWDWQDPAAEPPRTAREHVRDVPYAQRAVLAAGAWKVKVLGPDHPVAFGEGHLLPAERAVLNLLPEAAEAVEHFKTTGTAWHQAVSQGPGRNLLSSQVQCVNALFPMASDGEKLRRAFGSVLDMAEVEPVDGELLIAFEYVGPGNPLGEASGGGRTAVDAALRYREPGGTSVLALVEWKYTESYFGTTSKSGDKYKHLWAAPDGPLLTAERSEGPLVYDDVLVEPFYQLVRQQLLAWQLEQSGVADVVRVVHVSPAANEGYQRSLPRARHREVGSSVAQVWQQLQRRPDRFRVLPSDVFLDPALTSRGYVERYGHP